MAAGSRPIAVGVEVTAKKAFAWALEWPGWCRAGRTPEAAVEALAAYHARFVEVTHAAGVRPPARDTGFDIVERVDGDVTTEFGAPGAVAPSDRTPVTAGQTARIAKLVTGAWTVLDTIAASSPESLRKGPRGGGRDLSKMLQHVVSAERSYARKLGVKVPDPAYDDEAAVAAMRAEIVAVFRRASDGSPLVDNGWPYRYAARRIAWHVLDHAWEIEDRR